MHWKSIPFLFILFYHGFMRVKCEGTFKGQNDIVISETDRPERIVQAATAMKLEDIVKLAPDNENERTEIDKNIILIHNSGFDDIDFQKLQEFVFDDKSNGENGFPIIPPKVPQITDKILEKNAFDGYITYETTLYLVIAIILLMHIYNSPGSE